MATKKDTAVKTKDTAAKRSLAEIKQTDTKKKVVTKAATAGESKKTKAAPARKPPAKQPAVSKAKAASAEKPVRKAATKKNVAVKSTSKKTQKMGVSPEERYRMVETAAYFIAEHSGFQGDSTAHWAAAERQIAALLKD